jgi:hypothetical protein
MLPAVWVLGTVISTGVAYAAVQTVSGSVVEGQREPLASTPFQAASPSPAPGPPTASNTPEVTPTPGSVSPSPTPTQSQPPRSPSPPPTQAASSSRTFALVGGTTQLTCGGGSIVLNWATPNSGFWVETSTENGGATIEVRFRSDAHESRLDAWCATGRVQFSVREQPS